MGRVESGWEFLVWSQWILVGLRFNGLIEIVTAVEVVEDLQLAADDISDDESLEDVVVPFSDGCSVDIFITKSKTLF